MWSLGFVEAPISSCILWYVKRLRVGVLYGGRSGEHEVSLASAAAVFANLDPTRYEPVPLRIGKERRGGRGRGAAVPVRIEREGRWALAHRPATAVSAAEVIEHARLEAARPSRGG